MLGSMQTTLDKMRGRHSAVGPDGKCTMFSDSADDRVQKLLVFDAKSSEECRNPVDAWDGGSVTCILHPKEERLHPTRPTTVSKPKKNLKSDHLQRCLEPQSCSFVFVFSRPVTMQKALGVHWQVGHQ